jgi:hypothetical protein
VLAERDDRPVRLLADVEQQQLKLVREIARGAASAGGARASRKERKKQTDRERSAAAALPALAAVEPGTALATLNLYCKKTKAELAEDIRAEAGEHIAAFTYKSCLRVAKGLGRAPSTEVARQRAAAELLSDLLSSLAKKARKT